jgi:hypothetical protein
MKTILFLIFLFFTMLIHAQNYKQTLVGNTWLLTSLKMNGEVFIEVPGTCVYSTEINFFCDSLLTLNRPCIGVTQQSFQIINNLLILNNKDTLTITNLSSTSFETSIQKEATDDQGNVSVVNIITTYEKI